MVSLNWSYNDHCSECLCVIFQLVYFFQAFQINSIAAHFVIYGNIWRNQVFNVTIICLHPKIAEHCIIRESGCKYGKEWNAWMDNSTDSSSHLILFEFYSTNYFLLFICLSTQLETHITKCVTHWYCVDIKTFFRSERQNYGGVRMFTIECWSRE